MVKLTPLALSLALFSFACASTETHETVDRSPAVAPSDDEGGKDEDAEAEKAKEKQEKKEELAHKIAMAKARLSLQKMETDSYEAQQAVRLRHAAAEVDMAEAKLALFTNSEAPRRLASERLDLRSVTDRAKEAAEELAQIEIMYEGQDLDDVTAEFVVSRGRRTAERAAQRIEIQESALKALEEHELPQEESRLRLAAERAAASLEEAEREIAIARRRKGLERKEALRELKKLEKELAELSEEDSGEGDDAHGEHGEHGHGDHDHAHDEGM